MQNGALVPSLQVLSLGFQQCITLMHALCCTATPGTSQVGVALVHARRYIPGRLNALLLRRRGWFPFWPAGTVLTCVQQQLALGLLRISARSPPLGHVAVCRQYIVGDLCISRAML